MKKLLITALLGTGLLLGACGGDDSAKDSPKETITPDAANGEKVVQASCIGCHGGDLTGGAGPDLTKLTDKAHIEKVLTEGQGGMPAMKLTDQEKQDVAAYITSLK